MQFSDFFNVGSGLGDTVKIVVFRMLPRGAQIKNPFASKCFSIVAVLDCHRIPTPYDDTTDMSRLKIMLTLRGTHDHVDVDSGRHEVSFKDGKCSVVVPIHDWWTHTQDFVFHKSGADIKQHEGNIILEFTDETNRTQFHKWLLETFADAEAGYKTMYP